MDDQLGRQSRLLYLDDQGREPVELRCDPRSARSRSGARPIVGSRIGRTVHAPTGGALQQGTERHQGAAW